MTKTDKSKEDRLKEGISLLKQMLNLIKDNEHPGYLELKAVITTWINDGKAYDGKIEFYDHQRYAEVSLPRTANKAATVGFKAIKQRNSELYEE
jgi:hypothetical protein